MEGWCILMANLYSEIRPDLRPVADYLEERHITYRAYRNGIEYEAEDRNGVPHSYFPTTGTIQLNLKKYQKGSKKKTIRNSSKEQFLRFLLNPELILRQEVLHEDY